MRQAIQAKMDRGDFNFEGYVFTIPVNFREKIFPEFVSFENCRFLGRETSFYRTSFKKGVLFNGSVFRGGRINFSRAQMGGDFNLFNGALFDAQDVNFLETSFSGKHIGFASARFTGHRLDFKEAEFQGTVFFTQTHFGATLISFEKVKFSGGLVSFSQSHFEGKEFLFKETRISTGQLDFSNCHFKTDHVSFEGSRLEGKKTLFAHASFQSRRVSFQNCVFNFDLLSFVHSSFQCREVDFSETGLTGGTADFSNSFFQAKSLKLYPITLDNRTTHFNRSEFSGEEKTFFILNPRRNDLSFQEVFFHGGRTKLKGDLQAASFLDTSLDNVDFNEAHWGSLRGRLLCRDETDAIRVNTPAHFRKAADVCRSIKKCYESSGDYETAGDFYYGEMECKRKLSPRRSWGGLQFMRLTSGYGEKPIRVIFTSLFVILGSALLYLFGGVNTPGGIIRVDAPDELAQFPKIIHDFLNCIYFSVVSFTTLGYGDYHPAGWSRVVGASEGFIGAFFMAMFVLTVGRKMNR
jgi:ion channel